jgi:hypothetical protein
MPDVFFSAALSGERRYREASSCLSEASKLIKDHQIDDLQLQVNILDVSAGLYFQEGQVRKAEARLMR